MTLKYTIENSPIEEIPHECEFTRNILIIKFELTHIAHLIIEEKKFSGEANQISIENEEDEESQSDDKEDVQKDDLNSDQDKLDFITAKKEKEKREKLESKNRKKREYEFFTTKIRDKKIVFKKTCYVHEICEDVVVKTFSTSDLNTQRNTHQSELMRVLDFPTVENPFNVRIFGIRLKEDEKHSYLDRIRIQTHRLINRYLIRHGKERCFEIPTQESKILDYMHAQLNENNLEELEKQLQKTITNKTKAKKTGQYYLSIEEVKMPSVILYVEDDVAQRLLSIENSTIKEYKLKVNKLEIEECFDFSEIKFTNGLVFQNESNEKEFYFMLNNYIVLANHHKILDVIEIPEIKYIIQSKVYRFGEKMFIVGGYMKKNAVEESNQILTVVNHLDKNQRMNQNFFLNKNTVFQTIRTFKSPKSSEHNEIKKITLFNRHIFDSHKREHLLILLSRQKESTFIDIFDLNTFKVIHQVNLNKFYGQIFTFMKKDLLCITDGFQTKLFDLSTGDVEIDLRLQHSFEISDRCWLRSLELLKDSPQRSSNTQKNDKLVNLTNKPILISNDESTFFFNSEKSYKVDIICMKEEDSIKMLILKLRSYWFLKTCDLEYAQRMIFPFLETFSSFTNKQKNVEFYNQLMILAYDDKKIKKTEIFKELENLMTDNVMELSLEEMIEK